jgi:DNA polymerase III epsilon subunit-like protein
MVQLAWILADDSGNILEAQDRIIFPDGYKIPEEVSRLHGITTEIAREKGVGLDLTLVDFSISIGKCELIIAHNVSFDRAIIEAESFRVGNTKPILRKPTFCTKEKSTNICKIPGSRGGYKWPKLQELHHFLFGHHFDNAHNALNDVNATVKCFFKLKEMGVV